MQHQPRRILVVGCPGSGKSTLARRMADRLGLPVVHLDQLWWSPGWVERDRETYDRLLTEACAGEVWIMDGNNSRTFDLRMARADTVVWLDRSRWTCLWRIVRRVVSTYGRVRPDMAEGCPERFDWEFMVWIWKFKRDHDPLLLPAVERHRHLRLFHLRSDAEGEAFLASLG